jgi:hypothetical protein
MSYAQFVLEDRRLVLLRALLECAQYTSNAFLLQRFSEQMGHAVSSDVLATDLAWLAEQGLLATRQADGVLLATLGQRGADVATGRATVPGVKRPAPGY